MLFSGSSHASNHNTLVCPCYQRCWLSLFSCRCLLKTSSIIIILSGLFALSTHFTQSDLGQVTRSLAPVCHHCHFQPVWRISVWSDSPHPPPINWYSLGLFLSITSENNVLKVVLHSWRSLEGNMSYIDGSKNDSSMYNIKAYIKIQHQHQVLPWAIPYT